jgi:glucokinase
VILAADVGGTNARLSLFSTDGKTFIRKKTFASKEYPSFEAVVRDFVTGDESIEAVCVGVAGPVIDGRCEGTNFPWFLDERDISAELGLPRAKVRLINDLQALALGALTVPAEKLVLLHGTEPPKTEGVNLAIIAAGTGLGKAMLIWDGTRHVACPTEGGHVDYAPRTDLEIEFLRYLRAKLEGRVSWERVVAGPGLGHLYDFFRDEKAVEEDPTIRAAIDAADDRNAAVTQYGMSGESGPAARAVEYFISAYGADTGNLALSSLALGGIFVAGGIAKSLLPLLAQHGFVRSYLDKGRMRPVLEKIPVALVPDSQIGLYGSALCASRLL